MYMVMFLWLLVLVIGSVFVLFGVAIDYNKDSCLKVKWFHWIIVGSGLSIFLFLDIYFLYKIFNIFKELTWKKH